MCFITPSVAQTTVSIPPYDKIFPLMEQAAANYDDGNHKDALLKYKEAMRIMELNNSSLTEDYLTVLNYMVFIYKELIDNENALQYAKKSLKISKQLYGTKHESYASALNNIGEILFAVGEYENALKYFHQTLEIQKEVLGEKHPIYAASLNNIGMTYTTIGDYENAQKYILQAIDIRKEVLGEMDPIYALSLRSLGEIYFRSADYKNALKYLLQVLDINKNTLGEEHPNYLASLCDIGTIYSQIADYENALKYQVQASEIYKSVLGEEHPDYAMSLNSIGLTYYYLGSYEDALSYYLKSLDIFKVGLGDNHPNYGLPLSNIGMAYYGLGDYENALKYQLQTLDLFKKVFGDKHPNYAFSLNNIGQTYLSLGNYEDALKYFLQALALRKEVLGENHPDYAMSINNVAMVYNVLGSYEDALGYYLQALKVIEEILGEDHPYYAMLLNNTGEIYRSLGNYENALTYYIQAKDIRKEVLGEKHVDYAMSLNNIGLTYYYLNNYENALKYLLESSDVFKEAAGASHPNYAMSLNNIGHLYNESGDYTNALNILQQALKIRIDAVGELHHENANTLNNMGLAYRNLNDNQNALRCLTQALQICEEILNEFSPLYMTSLYNTMCLYKVMGDYDQAVKSYKQIARITKTKIINNFKFLNEQQRAMYWKTQEVYVHYAYELINSSRSHNTSNTYLAYDAALFSKGLLLASSVELRKVILESGDEELVGIFDKARGIERRLQESEFSPEERDSLVLQSEVLNRELMGRSKEFGDFTRNLSVDWSQVQSALKRRDIAVEFVDYTPLDSDTTQYAALLLRKGWKNPKMVPLTTDVELNKFLQNKSRAYSGSQSKELYKLIWSKIEPYVKKGENIYFSPSGVLHQMNIEVLADGNSLEANKKYNLYRVSSTRKIYENRSQQQYKSAALYGGLRYDVDTTQMIAQSLIWSERDSSTRDGWSYLPSSKVEVDNIAIQMQQKGIKPLKYIEEEGTEESFKALSGSGTQIIHIATHGFFLKDEQAKQKQFMMQMIGDESDHTPRDNSMKRSGLILSGGQKAWLGETVPERVDDGVLLSEEISVLDLRGTDLVVLSACNTALGDVNSEGVFGLQRAFKMAGVETIVMSLWQVSDEATSLMMQTFYEKLLSGKTKREAFMESQEEVKSRYSEPYYWASFILLD